MKMKILQKKLEPLANKSQGYFFAVNPAKPKL